MAGILVRRHWHQKAVVAVGRRVARWRKIDEPRRRLLLDFNPMTWLALRFQQPRLEWAPVFLFGTISLASLGLGPAGFLTFSLGTGWLINFMMKMRLAGESARIGSDLRQDSQLELIVTTPLGAPRMVEGLGAGLRAMIFPGAAALLALEFATLVTGLILTEHSSASVGMSGVYVMALLSVPLTLLDFYAFAHTGLWLGFSSGKASAGINRTQLRLLVLPFLATIIFSIGMASTVGYLVGYLFSLGFLLQSQSRMKSEFAAIATGQQGILPTPVPSFIFPAPPESPPVYRI